MRRREEKVVGVPLRGFAAPLHRRWYMHLLFLLLASIEPDAEPKTKTILPKKLVDRVFHVSRLYLKGRRGQSISSFRSFAISTRRVPFHHHPTKTLQPLFHKKGLSVLDPALRFPHLRFVTFPLSFMMTPHPITTATHTTISSPVLLVRAPSCIHSCPSPVLAPTTPHRLHWSLPVSFTILPYCPVLHSPEWLLPTCLRSSFSFFLRMYVRTDCASVTR
jgi:hypothetical protein